MASIFLAIEQPILNILPLGCMLWSTLKLLATQLLAVDCLSIQSLTFFALDLFVSSPSPSQTRHLFLSRSRPSQYLAGCQYTNCMLLDAPLLLRCTMCCDVEYRTRGQLLIGRSEERYCSARCSARRVGRDAQNQWPAHIVSQCGRTRLSRGRDSRAPLCARRCAVPLGAHRGACAPLQKHAHSRRGESIVPAFARPLGARENKCDTSRLSRPTRLAFWLG